MRTASTPGAVIARLLRDQGRDGRWLSEQTGINHLTVTGIIDGALTPTLEDGAVIADALRVPLDVLTSEKESAVDAERVARTFHLSAETVRRKAKAGEIPAFRLGDGPRAPWRFYLSEVHARFNQPKADPWAQSARSLSRKRRVS